MRLEPGNHAAIGKVLRALDACGNLRRVMRKIVHEGNAIERPQNLVTAEHARESRQRIGTRMERHTSKECRGRCRKGVFHVVLARKRHFEIHEFRLVAHAELDMRTGGLEVRALHAHIVFKTEIEFATRAELLCQRVRVVHNEDLAVVQNVVAELEEDFLQFVHLLVVLVHIEDEPDFRFVAHERSIAFVGFNNEPFALATNGVTDLAFLLQVHEAGPRHHGGLKSRILQNVVNHRGHGRLSARTAHRNRAGFFRNLREHLATVHHRDAEFLCTLQIGVRILDSGTHHHGGQARDNARAVLREALDSAVLELAHHERLFALARQEFTELTVGPAHRNALARQVLSDGTHAHASNTDKEVRFHI